MFLVSTSSQPFLQDPKDCAQQRHVDCPGAVEGRHPRSPAGSPALSLKELTGIHGDSWDLGLSWCIMKIDLTKKTKTKKK